MLTQHVHSRLGLPKFLQFEPYYIAAFEGLERGEATELTMTGGLSPSTIAARMRDSLHGFRLNRSEWINKVDPKFVALYDKYEGKFSIAGPDENNKVWIRFRHAKGGHQNGVLFHQVEGQLDKYVRRTTIPSGQASTAPAPQALFAKGCTMNVVQHYAHLKGLGELDLPVVFPGPIDPNVVDEITNHYDLAFHYDPNTNKTILV